MHVANVWYNRYVWRAQHIPGRLWIEVLAYLQFLGKIISYRIVSMRAIIIIEVCCDRNVLIYLIATIGTRAHFLTDLPAGVILAEFAARVFFLPMERRAVMNTPRALPYPVLPFIVLIPAAIAAGLSYLETITGWGGFAEMLK